MDLMAGQEDGVMKKHYVHSVSGSGGVMFWAAIIHNSIVCIDIMYMKFHNTRFKIVRNTALKCICI